MSIKKILDKLKKAEAEMVEGRTKPKDKVNLDSRLIPEEHIKGFDLESTILPEGSLWN